MTLDRRGLMAGLAAGLVAPAAFARTYGDAVNTIGENLDQIRAKGRIRIAFYRDFFPYAYEAGGRWTGIDVDLAALIAERLGVALEPMPFTAGETVDDDLRNVVWRGSVVDKTWANLLLHVPVNRELEIRSELAVVFGAYHVERLALALDPDRFEGEFTAEDLVGRKVGVEIDTLGDFWLSMAEGGRVRDATVHFPTPELAATALKAGELDAMVAPIGQLEALLGAERARMELRTDDFAGLAVTSWPIGCSVRENARDLGYAVGDIVDAAMRDGAIPAIFARHGVTWRAPVVLD